VDHRHDDDITVLEIFDRGSAFGVGFRRHTGATGDDA
jgi:hypothetical protein